MRRIGTVGAVRSPQKGLPQASGDDSFLRKTPSHFHHLLPPFLGLRTNHAPPRANQHLDPESLRRLRPTQAHRSSFIAARYGHTLSSLAQRVAHLPQVETSLKERLSTLLKQQSDLTQAFNAQRLVDLPC